MGTRSVFVLILRASAAMEDEEVAFRVRPRHHPTLRAAAAECGVMARSAM